MDIEKAIDQIVEATPRKLPKFKVGDIVMTHGGHRKYEIRTVYPRKPFHEQSYLIKEVDGAGLGVVAESYLKLAE